MLKRILLVYFSGTGGTKRVADTFETCFSKNDCDVIKQSLDGFNLESLTEKYNNNFTKEIDLIFILFPVYAMTAPKVVFEWIESLPSEQNTKTAVISVSGGGEVWPNTSCRVNCIKALKKKHYNVVYEKMMVMPPNVLLSNNHAAMHIINSMPLKVNGIVSDLLAGKKLRSHLHISTYLFGFLHLENNMNKMGKSLKVNSTCTSCGFCVKNCPRGNITIANNVPSFNNNCAARDLLISVLEDIYLKTKVCI